MTKPTQSDSQLLGELYDEASELVKNGGGTERMEKICNELNAIYTSPKMTALYVPKPDETVESKAIAIYEATRVEAAWSNRPIVPEPWADRDGKFRKQFVDIIDKYLNLDVLPTPEEAHNSWMQSYFDMGWEYGETRDTVAKTHPDLLPFNELSQAERDKDAIFLAFVWVARELAAHYAAKEQEAVLQARIEENDYHWHHQKAIETEAKHGGVSGYFLERKSDLTNQLNQMKGEK